MGVKDLMRWVTKNYPQVVKEFPARWAADELRGKRVAIDGTLLTNRFHFAVRDVDARGAQAILGWYGMIQEMRAHGVQPIAVWDERGDRPWKAPEARRRLETRARLLARHMHEERRSARVRRLRDRLAAVAALGTKERDVIAGAWARGDERIPTREAVSLSPSHALSMATTALLVTVSHAVAHISALCTLYDEFVVESDTGTRQHTSEHPAADAFEDEEEEVCRITSEWEGAPGSSSSPAARARLVAATELLADQRAAAAIDARLRLLPAAVYTESPRQRELTALEGEVYDSLFGVTPVEVGGVNEGGRRDAGATLAAALATLDEIESRAPAVQSIYTRALAMPLEEHHAGVRELLRRMGVPTVFAGVPFEAEGLCSALAAAGAVDFVGTEDSDVVVYGGPLLRNLTVGKAPLVLIDSGALAITVPLAPRAWHDFCILLGTDASPRIPQIGPVRAFSLVQRHGSIEGILRHERDIARRVEPDFMAQVHNARTLFSELPPVPSLPAVQPQTDEQVRAWIYATYGVAVPAPGDEERVDAESGDELAQTAGDFGAEDWGHDNTPSPQPPRVASWDDTWDR